MQKNIKSNNIIDAVEVTDDTLTSRGGLSLFVRYLRNTGLLPHFESELGGDPQKLKDLTGGLITMLEAIGKFVAAVFAPFLAFVLGYYFRGDPSENSGK